MQVLKFRVTGMSCAACSAHVERAVRETDGVLDVSVSLLTSSMSVTVNDSSVSDDICRSVKEAGYGAEPAVLQRNGRKENNDIRAENWNDINSLTKRLFGSLVILLPLIYISMGYVMWGFPLPRVLSDNPIAVALIEMCLCSVILIIHSRFFTRGLKSLYRSAPSMDTLVALGSGASFLYSLAVLFRMSSAVLSGGAASAEPYLHDMYFESSAMIVTLITVGKTLEEYSRGKTTVSIRALMELAPDTAHVIRDGNEITIDAASLAIGDRFIIRPGERIPADGYVVSGSGAVDESSLTGESMPVDKTVGDKVSAGTLNLYGSLTCFAENVSGHTALDRIISLVEEAASSKAPVSRMADRISAVFVPAVLAIALITFSIWILIAKDIGFSLTRAVSVLVISCPCALGLATPVAIMVGSGTAAKYGILYKNATILETTAKCRFAVLDKTGTVTEGKPYVTDLITAPEIDENEFLIQAASLESGSEHPLARSIVEFCGCKTVPCENFKALPGFGIEGTVNGQLCIAGNLRMMLNRGITGSELYQSGEKLTQEGKTPVFFAQNGSLTGVIGTSDVLRSDSIEAVAALKDLGLRVILLSGDTRASAENIGVLIGADAVISDVLPEGKDRIINTLREYGPVAMIGDGINDAPALMRADIGIAVGAGTDAAIEAADIVLSHSGIASAVTAIKLSKSVRRNVRENLFWAFFYNLICIPLAAGVFIPLGIRINPMIGAAAMSLSSFCVVTNALRLNLFNPSKVHFRKFKAEPLPEFVKIQKEREAFCEYKEEQSMKKTVHVKGMMCMHCVAHVKKALEAVEGISEAAVSLENNTAVVSLSEAVPEDALKKAVEDAGYEVTCIE